MTYRSSHLPNRRRSTPATPAPAPAPLPSPIAASAAARRDVFDDVVQRLKSNLDDTAALCGLSAKAHEDLQRDLAQRVLSALLVTGREVGTLLVLADDTVSQWCREGRLPGAINLGRAGWRVPLQAVLALTTPPTDPSTPSAEAAQPTEPESFDTTRFAEWRTAA
jgi:hypothetical protein